MAERHPAMKLLQSFTSRFTRRNDSGSVPVPGPGESATRGQVERRICARFPITSQVTVSWQDAQGQRKHVLHARAVNMSSLGVAILLSEPLPVGSAVYVQAKELRVEGTAHVRHCTLRGSKFLTGLEYQGCPM